MTISERIIESIKAESIPSDHVMPICDTFGMKPEKLLTREKPDPVPRKP